MTAAEMSTLLKGWIDVASKRGMIKFRKSLCDCRDILDGLLDGYPQYVARLAPEVMVALAGMNQNEEVKEVTKAFEDKMKEFPI